MAPIRIHCGCHVVILRNPLLDAEILITLIFRFVTDVGDARFLVLKDISSLPLRCHALDFVGWKRRIDFLLLRRLRRELGLICSARHGL